MKYKCILLLLIITLGCNNKLKKMPQIVHFESFPSKFVPARNIDIWLPSNYSNDKKYSVLYMHDGQMLFDSTTTWNKQAWMVGQTMEKLIAENKIKETIVVGISNISELRTIEYFPNKAYQLLPDNIKDDLHKERLKTKPESDNYLKFITKELKPYIDETYNTYTDMENTFIAGSSMGGLISMYAICEYPEIFGGAACLSTHWPGGFEENIEIPTAFKQYMEINIPSFKNHKIYFDYGTETLDSLYKPYQLMIDTLMITKGYKNNSNWITKEFHGHAHTETDWAKRLFIPLEFLLRKS